MKKSKVVSCETETVISHIPQVSKSLDFQNTVSRNINVNPNNVIELANFQNNAASLPKNKVAGQNAQLKEDLHAYVVGLLSKTELSKKYAGEYNSWRDAKYRCKKQKLGVFDPRFNDFTDFLRILGPKPGKDYTLDRFDHSNPEYSPENTRWASKQLQSINRKNVRYLTNANTGEKLPLTVWAKKLNIPAATIRGRLAKGWSEHEALYGLTSAAVKTHNPVKTHKMGDIWKSYVPHLDSDQVESNYQQSRIQLSRSPKKFEGRIAWLYRIIYRDLHLLYEDILLVHNPEEPDTYPVPPQLHERYMRGDALLESIRLRMSAREIEIAHLKIRNLI